MTSEEIQAVIWKVSNEPGLYMRAGEIIDWPQTVNGGVPPTPDECKAWAEEYAAWEATRPRTTADLSAEGREKLLNIVLQDFLDHRPEIAKELGL